MSTALSDPKPLDQDDLHDQILPRRKKRRFLTGPSAVVLALVTCAIGFYGGIRVEKSHVSSTSTGTGRAGFASRLAAAGGASTGAGSTAATGKTGASAATGKTGSTSFRGGAGFGAGAGGFGGAGGGTAGTVSSINGNTLVLDETGGNKVDVKLSSATKYTKSVSVAKGRIYPGDTISVAGVTAKSGTISATSVSDSGDSSTSSSSSSSSSSTAGSSGVASLFGGG